jgi:hypothetical protein
VKKKYPISKAVAILERKKKQLEKIKEVHTLSFVMTKEKFDSIPDNLMIRKLQVNINPVFTIDYQRQSMMNSYLMTLRKRNKVIV